LVSAALAGYLGCGYCLSHRRHRRSVIVSFHGFWLYLYV
jgi:hypothetical protein